MGMDCLFITTHFVVHTQCLFKNLVPMESRVDLYLLHATYIDSVSCTCSNWLPVMLQSCLLERIWQND